MKFVTLKNFLGVSELSYRESYRKSDISFVKTLYRRCIGKFLIYRNVRFGSSSFFVSQWFKNFVIIRSKLKKSIENRFRFVPAQLLDAKFIWDTEARVNSFHRAIKIFTLEFVDIHNSKRFIRLSPIYVLPSSLIIRPINHPCSLHAQQSNGSETHIRAKKSLICHELTTRAIKRHSKGVDIAHRIGDFYFHEDVNRDECSLPDLFANWAN